MKLRLFLFMVLLCNLSLSAQEKFRDTIPFRNDLGLIIIPIQFNGQEKNFVFDTGATHSIGYSWVKDALKKTRKTLHITSSNNARSKLRYYKSDSVNLASARISKHKILRTSDSSIFSCHNIDGILGMDIISHFNWFINFEDQYLVMYDHDYFPKEIDEKMYALDFVYENKRPWVFFTIDNTSIKFLLDTGATDSDINIRYEEVVKKLSDHKKEIYSAFFDFNGVMNKTKSSIVKLSEINSGAFIADPIFDFGEKGSKIGNSLWKGSSVFLSTKNNKLYCSASNIDEYRESYGSSFILENGKITVIKVVKGSLAWKNGLRQGTEVLKINGKRFEDFCSIYKFQSKMAKEKNELNIILDNGKIITLTRESLF